MSGYLADFLKTNLTKFAGISGKASKGRFRKADKLQNHSNEGHEGKGKENKKEQGEGKE